MSSWQIATVRDSYRAETQDRRLVLPRPDDGLLLVVADGVGGRFGGAQAAQAAIDLAAAHHSAVAVGDAARWAALLVYVDGEIADQPDAGQTTMGAVEVTERALVGASVGDSRALFFADNGKTLDLTERQQRKPFVGTGYTEPRSFDLDLPPDVGGTLLLASDGLFDYAEAPAIEAAVRHSDLDEAARLLARAARGQHSNHLYDDLTIILCRRIGCVAR